MFGIELSRRQLKWLAYGLIGLSIVSLLLIGFWPTARALIQEIEPFLKVVGYVIGPLLAVFGFFVSRLDKLELTEANERLGKLKQEVHSKEGELEKAEGIIKSRETVIVEREERIGKLEADLTRVTRVGQLWNLRPPRPFVGYDAWRSSKEGACIITVALFKGGVGKTHLCANLAAYLSEKHRKPVLLIDLDYQGSLTSMMLRAAGQDPVGSKIDRLFSDDCDPLETFKASVGLSPILKSVSIIPADYSLEDAESKLLFGWVIDKIERTDPMFRLARILLDPRVRKEFAAIIIDTPPRMTMGTLNAFVASHYYVTPVILDRVSSEALKPFLQTVKLMSGNLGLNIQLGGIVASMTRERNRLISREPEIWEQVGQSAIESLGLARDPRIARHIPRKAIVTNDVNEKLPYYLTPPNDDPLSEIYDAVFDELWQRIMADRSAAL